MISDKGLMIRTAVPGIYDSLVDAEKLFLKRHHLFVFGLVYGMLHKLKHDKRPDSDMVYVNQIKEVVTKDMIDIVFQLLDDGNRDEDKLFEEMLRIADGGVVALKKIYDENKDFTTPNLILESERLWSARAKELNNINFKSAD